MTNLEKIIQEIQVLFEEGKESLEKSSSIEELEKNQHLFLGKKGKLTALLRNLSEIPKEERPRVGQEANRAKEALEALYTQRRQALKNAEIQERLEKEWVDFTLPGAPVPCGQIHPLSQVLQEIKEVFLGMGFEVVSGPEIETDYYNFEALNMPQDHPAREMWDSFYLGEKTLLRTHTSPVQIRVMEKRKPPLRVISAGKCFRRDAVDATHHFQFHQVEGFMVDENVTMANLKGVLTTFARAIFGPNRKVKFVPSYFPFTEPSAEVYIDCFNCADAPTSSCPICHGGKWLEILGAGMIHPFVLRVVNIPSNYTGFAFGLGVERIAMLKYGIDDIRLFYESDLRFLKEF
jgi:phenylalanyl-tRNA synthetase alpha chain